MIFTCLLKCHVPGILMWSTQNKIKTTLCIRGINQRFFMIHSLYNTDFVSVVVISAMVTISRQNRPRVISWNVIAFPHWCNFFKITYRTPLGLVSFPQQGQVGLKIASVQNINLTVEPTKLIISAGIKWLKRYLMREGWNKATWRLMTNSKDHLTTHVGTKSLALLTTRTGRSTSCKKVEGSF